MCDNKHKKHENYNKTERYLREETENKNVGQNQASNKVGQTDVQRNQQGSQHKEHQGKEHEKGSKKSNFHKN